MQNVVLSCTSQSLTKQLSIGPSNRVTVQVTDYPTPQPSSKPIIEAPTMVPSSSPITSQSKPVYIQNPYTGKILSIKGGICSPGTGIVLWKNKGYDFQKWFVGEDGSLESVYCPGMVMDIDGSLCARKFVKIYSKVNATSQVWSMTADGILRSVECNTGKAVDIRSGNTANGAQIIVYSEHGGWNQMWEMVPVPSAL